MSFKSTKKRFYSVDLIQYNKVKNIEVIVRYKIISLKF